MAGTERRKLIQVGVFLREEEILTRTEDHPNYHNRAEFEEARDAVMERVMIALSITDEATD